MSHRNSFIWVNNYYKKGSRIQINFNIVLYINKWIDVNSFVFLQIILATASFKHNLCLKINFDGSNLLPNKIRFCQNDLLKHKIYTTSTILFN